MKKLLQVSAAAVAFFAGTSAFAADLKLKAPIAPPPPVFTWTGFYVGGNVGYSWGRARTDLTETETATATITTLAGTTVASATATTLFTGNDRARLRGALGGLQAGYNWQTDRWVWGLEGDFQITGERGGVLICPVAAGIAPPATCPATGSPFGTADYSMPWFGTLRGRIGVAWDRVLFYGTGGLAVAGIKADYTDALPLGAPLVTPVATGSQRFARAGWVIGGGIEGALDNNWSVKLEYLHMDFGSFNQTIGPAITSTSIPIGDFRTNLAIALTSAFHTRLTDDVLRVGLNYRFGAL